MNESSRSPIRSSHHRCSMIKGVLRNFAKFTRKHLCQQLYLKRDFGTDVFLWILWNFQEQLFYRTPLGDCFWPILFKIIVPKNMSTFTGNMYRPEELQLNWKESPKQLFCSKHCKVFKNKFITEQFRWLLLHINARSVSPKLL